MTENDRVQTLLKAHRGVTRDNTRKLLLEVVTASHKLLDRLDTMTSDEFSKGGDKTEREALADLVIFEGEDEPRRFLRMMVEKHGHGGI